MKNIRITALYLVLIIVALFVLLSCNDDYSSYNSFNNNPLSDNIVNVQLFINQEDFQKPIKRSALIDEDNIEGSSPWVLVFRGNDDHAIFFEASRAVVSNGKFFVSLTKTTVKSRIVIIANPPDKFFDGISGELIFDETNINNSLFGKTYSQAVKILNTEKLITYQKSGLYIGKYIPMSVSLDLNGINKYTTIGSPSDKVQLKRIIAKVTIENMSNDFVIQGFTVIGAKQYGRFIESSLSAPFGNTIDYFASSPNDDPVGGISSGREPVYIYESTAGETSVIIKGIYNSLSGYYRLVFKDSDNRLVDIIRNKWYKFKINEVRTSGYNTVAEAINAPPANVMAELIVIDQDSMEIIDNGQYYLGLSNSEAIIYSDSYIDNLIAATITTNAPRGTLDRIEVVSSFPTGSLVVLTNKIAVNGSISITDLKISLLKNFERGRLRLVVGNLIRFVDVKRDSIIRWQETKLQFTSDYVSGSVDDLGSGELGWITLSTDDIDYSSSMVIRSDNPGNIYLKVKENKSSIRPLKMGIVYLARKDSQGNIKLYIDQKGNSEG